MALLKIVVLLFIGITVARKCKSPIELAVVVDASDSLSLNDVTFVKGFIKSVGRFFRIAVFSSHVSVVLAGSNVSDVIALNKIGANKFKFYKAVDKVVKPLGGEWSVDRGLQMIKKRVFTEENGMRSFLPRIVLVVTSGIPGNGNDIQHQIKNLTDVGAKVYMVSVGDVARQDELMRMIRNESSNMYQVQNFRELTSLASIIGEDICQTHYHDELAICKTKTDVGFIVDSSGSINNAGYLKMKTFMKAISVYLGFAPDALHVGAVLYSKEANLWTRFKDNLNLRTWFKKLWTMPHYRDVTRIDLGLDVANTQLFTRKSGMRDDAIKIAILFTDGEQTTRGINDLIPLREAADKLRERDITVFAVGIGKSVRKDQLLEIAKTSEYIITLSSFNELEAKTRKMAKDVCQLVNDPPIVNFTQPIYTAIESKNVTVGVSIFNNKRNTPVTIRIIPNSDTAGSNDFDNSITEIEFQPEQTGTKFVEISLINDKEYEATEEFTISLSSNSIVVLGNSSKVKILDDDAPPVIEFTRPVYEVLESENSVAVGISVTNGNVTRPVTVRIFSSFGTASTDDFVGIDKEITFQPGEIGPKVVQINLVNDRHDEPTEEFRVSLSSNSRVILGNSSKVKILDDDAPPVIEFTRPVYEVLESKDSVAVGISVTNGNVTRPVTVRIFSSFGTASTDDFVGIDKEITFQPGEIGPKVVQINLVNDRHDEPTEEFRVSLSSNSRVILGNSSKVKILDDDAPPVIEFTRPVYEVLESKDSVAVGISVTNGNVTRPVTVRIFSSFGTASTDDFVGIDKEITFQPGEIGPKVVQINLVNDRHDEPTEEFRVSLASNSRVILGNSSKVKILDDDAPPVIEFTRPVYEVLESKDSVAVGISVTNGNVTRPVTVRIFSSFGTASTDDFVGIDKEITFQPGEIGPKVVQINLVNDRHDEPTEEFRVSLSSNSRVILGNSSQVKILDDDAPPVIEFTRPVYEVLESKDSVAVGISVTNGNVTRPVTVRIFSSFGTASTDDFVGIDKEITFQPGEIGPKVVQINLVNDRHDEPTEEFRVSLASNSRVILGNSSKVKILDDDAPPVIEFTRPVYEVLESKDSVAVGISVTNGNVTRPVTVRIFSSFGTASTDDFVGIDKEITFQPGEIGPKVVQINLVNDRHDEPTEEFRVSLSSNSRVILGNSSKVKILDDDAPPVIEFTRPVYEVLESKDSVAVGISVTNGNVTRPVTVRIFSSFGTASTDDFVGIDKEITFQPGEIGPKVVQINLVNDRHDEPTEEFRVSLSSNSRVILGNSSKVKILDDDAPPVIEFTRPVYEVLESKDSVAVGISVTNGNVTRPVTVRIFSSFGTASTDDFVGIDKEITFQPGEIGPKVVQINLVNDRHDEPTEEFRVSLASNSRVILGNSSKVKILDDDAPPVIEFTRPVYEVLESKDSVAVGISVTNGNVTRPVTVRIFSSFGTASTDDFVGIDKEITFQPGEIGPKVVQINLVNDRHDEPTEEFRVSLASNSRVILGNSSKVKILDDDAPPVIEFTRPVYEVLESKDSVAVGISVTNGNVTRPVTVRIFSSFGTASTDDFVGIDKEITFQPGEIGPKVVQINLVNDRHDEPTEEFRVSLSSNSRVILGNSSKVKILDDDAPPVIEFTRPVYEVLESKDSVAVGISVTNGNVTRPVTVRIFSSFGTASTDDFVGIDKEITFQPGEIGPKVVQINLVNDRHDEPTEEFRVSLASNSRVILGNSSKVKILDDDAPPVIEFTRPVYEVLESKDSVAVGISVTNGNVTRPVTVRIFSSFGTASTDDFVGIDKEITFQPGEIGPKVVQINLVNDRHDEPTEEFRVSLSSNSRVILGNSSKVKILDDDAPPVIEFTRPVYEVLESKDSVAVGISVTNGNVTRPVTVRIFSSFGTASTDDFVGIDKEITFQPGEIGPKVVQINLVNDRHDEPTEEFRVSLSSNSRVILGNSSKVKILDDDAPPVIEFTRPVYEVLESKDSVAVGISVTNGNVTRPVTVRIFSSFGTASTDDFVGIDKEITFQPGEIGPKVVQINLVNDRHDEPTEEFRVSLSSNSRVILGNSSKVKILDDDAPPVIEFTRPVYEVLESKDSVAVGISVTNGNVTRPVTVRIFSSFGTASTDDFVGIDKEITFQPGEIGPKVVQINLVNDRHDEPTEEFRVSLSSNSRVILGNSSKVKILDDDAPPVIEFTRPVYEVLESKDSVAVGISVTNGNVTRPVTVRIFSSFGTASTDDFVGIDKEITFQPGEIGPKVVQINLVNDRHDEPTEEFRVSLSSNSRVILGNSSKVKILDDDAPPVIEFTRPVYEVLESKDSVAVGISVTNGNVTRPVTVRIFSSFGTASTDDFVGIDKEITFQPGEIGPKVVQINLVNDRHDEPTEEFRVSLSSNSRVILGNSSKVKILDDDAPPVIEFTRPVYEVLESKDSVAVGISVTNGNVTRPVTVRIFSSFGTASTDDFVGIDKEITFQPGEIGPKVVQINLVNDRHDEPTEEFRVSLSSNSRVILGNSSKVKILDDDAPPVIEFTRPVYEVLESKDSVAVGISVTNGNVTRPVTVRIFSSFGTASTDDFVGIDKEITFQPGEIGPKVVQINLVNDRHDEPTEEFRVSLSSNSRVILGNSSKVKILDDDAPPVIEFTRPVYEVLESKDSVAVGISVTNGNVTRPVTVRIFSSFGTASTDDFVGIDKEITFQPGEIGPKVVQINLVNDRHDEPTEEFRVSLSSNSRVILGNSSKVKILDDDAPPVIEFTRPVYEVLESKDSVAVGISVTNGNVTRPVTVRIFSSFGTASTDDFVGIDKEITFQPGEIGPKVVQINLVNDRHDEPTEEFRVSLSSNSRVILGNSSKVKILDDDAPPVIEFTRPVYEVLESKDSVAVGISVTNGNVTRPVTVRIFSSFGTASTDDFVGIDKEITFQPGEIGPKVVQINLVNDRHDEPTEEFRVSLSSNSRVILGNSSKVKILDDDAPPVIEFTRPVYEVLESKDSVAVGISVTNGNVTRPVTVRIFSSFGTASTDDFVGIDKEITFQPGEIGPKVVQINLVNDRHDEPTEEFRVSLSSNSRVILGNSSKVKILDDDAPPVIEFTRPVYEVLESKDSVAVGISVTNGNVTRPVTVRIFSSFGTASTDDFVGIDKEITFQPGEIGPKVVQINLVNDRHDEPTEEFRVSLSSNSRVILGNSSKVKILDDDAPPVIEFTRPVYEVLESKDSVAVGISVTNGNVTRPVTVRIFSSFGTASTDDFVGIDKEITFQPGEIGPKVVQINLVNDRHDEPTEEFRVSLASNSRVILGNSSKVKILDDDAPPVIEFTRPVYEVLESKDSVAVGISVTNGNVTRPVTVRIFSSFGTASTDDFVGIDKEITFQPGEIGPKVVQINLVNDRHDEPTEEFRVSLSSNSRVILGNSSKVKILDDDAPPVIEFTRPVYEVLESKDSVAVGISVTNGNVTRPVTVRIFSSFGTASTDDFVGIDKEITFQPGEIGPKVVQINLVNDRHDEPTEEFRVSLSSNSRVILGNSSKVKILDDDAPPVIEFTRPVYEVLESKDSVAVGISVTNGNVTRPVTVRIFSSFGTASTDDFVGIDKEITFQPGEIGPKVVQINLVNDRHDEPTEEFRVSLSSNSRVILGNSSKVKILDDDAPPVIEFTRPVYEVLESKDSVAVGISVTNGNVTRPVTVRIFSSFGTASTDDFVGIDKEITFQPGEIGPKVVQINLVNDRHDEPTEEFRVSLSSNSRVILGNSSKVKILDDDAPPVIEFTRPVYEVLESKDSVAVGISVTNGNVTRPVTVRIFSSFGTASTDDFVGIDKEITFQPGEIGPKVVQINLVNDRHDEPTEEFRVSLSSNSRVILGNSSQVKILDDDAPPVIEFTRPVYEVLESKDSVAVGISVTNGNVTRPVTVRIFSSFGTASTDDFVGIDKEITFQPGEIGPKVVQINLVNDRHDEPTEEFRVSLSSNSRVILGNSSKVKILDDDAPPVIEFTRPVYEVLESKDSVAVGISVTNGNVTRPVTVRIFSSFGTASTDDFVGIDKEITFQPGEIGPKVVQINLVNDRHDEPTEEFRVSLSSNSRVILGNSSKVKILDDDAPPVIEFTRPVYEVLESKDSVAVGISVTNGNVTRPVTVRIFSSFGTASTDDFVGIDKEITFQPGEIGPKVVQINLVNDRHDEPTEEFRVSLASNSRVILGNSSKVKILDDDAPPVIEFTRPVYEVLESKDSVAVGISVTNGNVTRPVTVRIFSSFGTASTDDFVGIDKEITFQPGEIGPKVVQINLVNDRHDEPTEEFRVSLSSNSRVILGNSSQVKILDDDAPPVIEFTRPVYEVLESKDSVAVGISVTNGNVTRPVTVRIFSSFGTASTDDFVGIDKEITFQPGEIGPKVVQINLVNDRHDEPTEEFRVSLSSNSRVILGNSSKVKILDDDAPPVIEFTRPVYEVLESKDSVAVGISVTNGNVTRPVTVRIFSSFGTASTDDFVGIDKEITFQPGEIGPKVVQINLVNDRHDEPTEEFRVSLASNSRVILGNSSKVKILDDDAPPVIEFTRPVYEVLESKDSVAVGISVTNGNVTRPVTVRIFSSFGTASTDDFVGIDKEITFQPGEIGPKVVQINLVNDRHDEPTEEFRVSLASNSRVILGNSSKVKILDDDAPPVIEFTRPVYEVLESKDSVAVGISVTNGNVTRPVTVRIFSSFGTASTDDFVGIDKEITFQPGEIGPKVVQINLVNDRHDEPTEEFRVSLASNSRVILGNSSKVKILDDDAPPVIEFTRPVYEVLESKDSVAVGISVTNGNVTRPVTVRIFSSFGTASTDDFVGIDKEITFQPGEIGPKVVQINLVNDRHDEPTEEFRVSLASNSRVILGNSSKVKILDDDGELVKIFIIYAALHVILHVFKRNWREMKQLLRNIVFFFENRKILKAHQLRFNIYFMKH
ncbi:uncharacterized protein LOC124440254 isoform X2 [Xenia sp. Carnegie-2017]|uniref:uncharacterized protein LOC124440254 isoform X2 n=1 Tax=Xenia sp. Carnegie-2017 TaxID=2897299 RepID=UPI001F03387C|nr:uncharacterized protein LOC124440254 isoform X2 [Xenia sp. Carnegie-2017]